MKKLLSVVILIFACSLAFSQITLTSTVTNATCFGGATGSATIIPTGGNAPYTYSITAPPQSNGTGIFSGLLAGTYSVIVSDAMAATNSITFTITEPSQILLNVTSTPALCNGTSTGTINITSVIGGNPAFTYNLNGSAYQGSSTFLNVPAGILLVGVRDINGCIGSNTVQVTEPTQLVTSISTQSVSCFGAADGAFTITATGGSPAYTFTTSAGLATNICSNLAAGVYTYSVTDANNCITPGIVSIVQPAVLSPTLTTTNPTCNGLCNGTGSLALSGGTGTTTFFWLPGLQSGNTLNNLCAGSQTVIITSNATCTASVTFTLTEPIVLTATTSVTNANCGQSNGAICATVMGGTAGYFIVWSSGSNSFCNANVPAGVYSYTLVDVNGCKLISNDLVNNIGGPTLSVTSQTNVVCFGSCTGAAAVSASGGATPYTYSWSQGQVTPTATNLCAGLYNATVTDASGCVGTASVNITQASTQINAFINSTNPTCFGQCTGTATVMSVGGNPPYTYNWNTTPSQTGSVISNICPGNWTCFITDVNGCTAAASVSIGSIQTFSTNITQIIGTCGTTCNGSATINTFGGNAPYTISSNGPVNINTFNPTNLCAGIYTVTATDINGCSFMNMLTINSLGSNTITNVTAITTSYDETCLQTSDGAIDLTITGSNPGPFTYLWNNGATAQDLNNISSNNYWVTILDGSSNCLVLRDTVNAIGTNCGTISGNVFIDNNSDCIKNTGDNSFINALVIINPGNKLAYTNANGDYIINNLPFGTYSITSNITNTIYIATCSASLSATINSTTPNVSNKNFVREFSPIAQPDLYVSAYSNGIVPGFVCRANYGLHNYNTFNANGVFKVTLPSAFIPNITNAFPAAYTLSGDTVIWNFTNINYTGWNYNFYIDFTTPLTTPLGSIFTTCMWAQPTATDLNYANNTYCYSRYVTGSFDPNDKTVSPLGIGTNGDISTTETDLTYLIRFQNTGNGPAVNIFIKDTLSPNVDINTFEMLSASHNYMIDVLPGNVLRWKFNNIMLPDSNSNEPASHGYIQYRIKRTNNNTPGTQIKNTAYIYFDFNEPVVTNTAINTIETITGIKSSFNTNDEWNVYPNPSTGALYIVNSSSVKEESQIQVINSIGQTVLEETITSNYKNMDLSKLNNGVYFVKILSDKHNVIKRVVLSK